MAELVLVVITSILPNGDISVGGQINARFGPVEADDLEVGQRLEVEVDRDDYPLMARTIDGQVVFQEGRM
jgi:hypothetical protein